MKRLSIITIASFLIDLISKIFVSNNFNPYIPNKVIDNFFYITYVKNEGAAWSILSGNRFFLIAVSIIALIFILSCILKEKTFGKLEGFSYGILLGGIVGNLFDRIVYGYVIDFLDFNIFGYNYPVFNIADCFIVIGVLIMIILSFRGDKNENRS